jgi:ubiquinone/menaquinone biosynthesis C-methylase UbiE
VRIHESAARGFAVGADAYERGRPDYSPDAVARLVGELAIGPGSRVLDLAAGTGKLTRQLSPTGAIVVAVEPVAEMRAKLAEILPDVEAIEGSAERIPLPDRSVDAVVVGQAFHWFDGVRALPEIHRVLVPSGGLGLIWQARDASRPWVARLDEIIDRHAGAEPRFKSGTWRAAFEATTLFEPLQEAVFEHVHRGDWATVVDRVASISYIAAMDADRQRAVFDEVRDLLATDSEVAATALIDLPYRSYVYWTRARPAQPRS